MKKISILFLILLSLLGGGCQRNPTNDIQNAALALYCRYADNEKLTVAYLGDYKMQGNTLNAVMIHADDEMDWERLQDDFAVPKDSPTQPDDSTYTVEMGVEWNTSVNTDEALLQKEHLDDDEIDLFAQAIVNQLSATLNSLLVSETDVKKAHIALEDFNVMDDLQIDMEFRDETASDRIMAAVAEKLKENGLAYNDTSLVTETVIAENVDSLMLEAKNYGQVGYVTAVDYSNRTLWVFFYGNADECNSILAHIRKDVFTKNVQE